MKETVLFLSFALLLNVSKPILCDTITSTYSSPDSSPAEDIVTVTTDLGLVRGKVIVPKVVKLEPPHDVKVQPVHQFLNIPYAAPPVGNLRFKKPEPIKPWAPEIKNGLKMSPACVQSFISPLVMPFPKLEESEDCLTLNIWTPSLMRKKDNLKPVYVYIHGGALTMGTAATDSGAVIASTQDVVYVNMNYRLGPFGFLVSPPGVNEELQAPGNVGLWDQLTALEWVRDHISNFGGNPDQITVGGLSAGGWSASLQTHSPVVKAKNLFRNVIYQSGSSLAPNMVHERNSQVWKSSKLARFAKCPTADDNAMMDCLQKVGADKLVMDMDTVRAELVHEEDFWTSFISWGPVYGDEFLPAKVSNLVQESPIKDLRVLAGVANFEGGLLRFTSLSAIPKWQKFTASKNVQNWISELEKNLIHVEMFEPSKAEQVAKFYFEKLNSDLEMIDLERTILNFTGDWYFNCPMRTEAEMLSKNGAKIYQYLATYKTKSGLAAFCPDDNLVCHGGDMAYLTGDALDLSKQEIYKFDDKDQVQAAETVNLLGKFIRNEELEVLTAGGKYREWPDYDLDKRIFVEMNAQTGNPTTSDFRKEFCEVLNDQLLLS